MSPGDSAPSFERDELLFFGLTPPRASVPPPEADRIAEVTLARLRGIDIDALLLYDIADESARTDQERPFPFLQTWDPAIYARDHLSQWPGPVVVYRSVGKYDEATLAAWFAQVPPHQAAVLVGASSSEEPVRTTLARALDLGVTLRPDVPLGAVAIPERHTTRQDEHLRLVRKQQAGCSFFVTQVVYDVTAAKNLVSDYAYICRDRGEEPARMVFTLSLCGSTRTLEFLEWLGIDVPQWVRNELTHARDPLGPSVLHALETARDLRSFCAYLDVPVGFNVESVSNRKVEIEAAVHLLRQLAFERSAQRP